MDSCEISQLGAPLFDVQGDFLTLWDWPVFGFISVVLEAKRHSVADKVASNSSLIALKAE
jgi:hypothetical protein